jgi:V/A-type H+-transporting ATPase subunit A
MNERGSIGKVIRIAGPVIRAVGLERVRLYDVVHVGELGLIGEVIRLAGDVTTVQVYEDTSGIRVGCSVRSTTGCSARWKRWLR